ncbi:serine/threonine-protein kinase [Chondromyces apiculatus]|uniref:Serine/threonine protein kinase PksC n=1 Tax=Chondromyces apiculatus DSM 436 TaxID=1192034 RepID=A0A017TF35_9BACT|nr:serine/threonine-protein kinase [Chondromyces apiculatus]EYF07512.1 serine/threonine protein kinase PksC [Chondromyces apiculatus DSM 436]
MMPPPRAPRAPTPDPSIGYSDVEQPGAVVAGKFQILDLLGRGGMGSVWRAQDLMLGRQVAIKFIRLAQDLDEGAASEARMRFEREARAAAQLRTRHVVQIYEYGFHEDTPYIVMEMLAGETLSQRLDRVGRFTPAQCARILDQTARALELAHNAGIVHRDLKPANIFLAREDSDEVVKILDFGVAQANTMALDGQQTATGRLVGSPFYMSPEQARGVRPLDGRSDLWSLAVILFRMLTGEKAFSGDSLGAVMVQILREPIPMPTHFAADLPQSLDRFFERAFARDRNFRFQSASEMTQAFGAIAGVAPVERWGSGSSESLQSVTMGTPISLSISGVSGVSLPSVPAPPAAMSITAPLTPRPVPIDRPSADQGLALGHSGTLTQMPWSPSVRRALWAAAGAGTALTVTGLVLVARVAFSDPSDPATSGTSAVASPPPQHAPALSGVPTAQPGANGGTSATSATPDQPTPASPDKAAPDPTASAAGTTTATASAAATTAEPRPAAASTAPVTQPARPQPPKRKPTWY